MIYLIGQLAVWLLLTALFAGLAGWAFASEYAATAEARLRRERDKLVNDLSSLSVGEGRREKTHPAGADAARSLTAIREGRIAELEQALQQQRARADTAVAELAEIQRRDEKQASDGEELRRLREQVAAHEAERARFVDAEAAPAPASEVEDAALQAWRLRYFEQRVRYLENGKPAAPAPAGPPEAPPIAEWRAREAEARARYLEQALREREETLEAEPNAVIMPFAADADVDALLRWRMLYLERRVAHLQGQRDETPTPAPATAVPDNNTPDSDRWKWRARYLEARVRHLEARLQSPPPLSGADAAVVIPAPSAQEERPPRQDSASMPGERPPGLPAAASGAADDLTLIDDITAFQQSALYSLGVYHFEQIAAWTPANVAWVDSYLRLRGRITEEEWLEQAADLAREGPDAARRQSEEEDA